MNKPDHIKKKMIKYNQNSTKQLHSRKLKIEQHITTKTFTKVIQEDNPEVQYLE